MATQSKTTETRALGYRNHAYEAAYAEYLNTKESALQLADAPPLERNLPLTVLSAGKQRAEWKDRQKELLKLTDTARHIVVQDSWHTIQIHRPDAVVEAVLAHLDSDASLTFVNT